MTLSANLSEGAYRESGLVQQPVALGSLVEPSDSPTGG
jgi:hypothetical protein